MDPDRTSQTAPEQERRLHTRVAPSAAQPVKIELLGEEVRLRDLGLGGVSFTTHHELVLGHGYPVLLRLPGSGQPLSLTLEVRGIHPRGLVHASFLKLEPEQWEALDSYVVERQRELFSEVIDSSEDPAPLIP